MKTVKFAIIGGGWRTEFYTRIAQALPERFTICGAYIRSTEKRTIFSQKWSVPGYDAIDKMISDTKPEFIVVSVPRPAVYSILKILAEKKIPVLTETPPADTLAELIELNNLVKTGARIQVAEQYIFQPIHAARLNIIRSGKLGSITQAQVSACHGFHGVSLIRYFLGIRFENPVISAYKFVSKIVKGSSRMGHPLKEEIVNSSQVIARLEFNGKLGIFDFTPDQYMSWVRSPRVLIRGEKGEINNDTVRYLKTFNEPVEADLKRMQAGEDGNLEGFYHKGILMGNEWVYGNPFIPARLSGDEIAVASSLQKMSEYADGGDEFYSAAEASQDHYIAMMIDKSVESGELVRTERQMWGT